jgi:hypothetical protein
MSADEKLRAAWSGQTVPSLEPDLAAVETRVRRHRAEVLRRDRVVYASAAIIIPSWAAVLWFMPDLRVIGSVTLAIGLWVIWHVHTRSGARLAGPRADLPCLAYQRSLLERERDFAISMPTWYFVPVAAGQVAIIATLATNPRFTTSQFYPEGLVLLVGTAGVALVVIRRRWRRRAVNLQRELDAVSVSVPASSMKESEP